MRLENPKRQPIVKDCTKFGIMEILEIYRKKLEVYKKPKLTHLVRLVYSDYLLLSKSVNWKCKCVTCWVIKDRFDPTCHPAHFRTAWTSLKHKYNDDNVFPCCYYCNVALNGNYAKYTLFMIDKFWIERVDNILTDKETITIKNYQYAEMISKRFDFITLKLWKLTHLQ